MCPHTLRQSGIVDGALLYLREERDVPPAPEVYDVPSFAAAATERMPALWSGTLRTVGLAAVAGLLLAGSSTAAVVLQGTGPGGGSGTLTGIIFAAALILLGAPVMRLRALPAGVALTAAGAAVSVTTAAWATADPGTGALLAAGGITLAMAAWPRGRASMFPGFPAPDCFGAGRGLGAAQLEHIRRTSGRRAGGYCRHLHTGCRPADSHGDCGARRPRRRPAPGQAHHPTQHLGRRPFGPRGAHRMDHDFVRRDSNRRSRHRDCRGPAVWAALLPLALLGALTFRGLSLPLLAQRAGVYVVAAAGYLASVIVFARAAEQPFLLAGAAAVGVLVLAASAARVRDQTAARLRVVAARIELCCVLSTIPLVLGLSGAYTQLGQTFG